MVGELSVYPFVSFVWKMVLQVRMLGNKNCTSTFEEFKFEYHLSRKQASYYSYFQYTNPLSGSGSGTSFLATEQPFQDVGKENRREVGAYFFRPLCLYFNCNYSTGLICERRIHFFNVCNQAVLWRKMFICVLAYFFGLDFHNFSFEQ